MERHKTLITEVTSRAQELFEKKVPFRIYHGSTNSTRRSWKTQDNIIDTSRLNRVLSVDPTMHTALVEPNVGMDELVEATLLHGMIPLVVMEFSAITVGGGFSGTSGESSSFRYGTFDATINWIEIVLTTGEVMKASRTEKPDLFWGAASAFGTLGIVTLLEVQLEKAQQYVQLTYHQVSSMADANTMLQAGMTDQGNDFIDGIIYAPDSIMIFTGRTTDTLPAGSSPRYFLRSWEPWFYIHASRVRKRLQKPSKIATATDFIPIRDYLFRYDRGAFWTARYGFKYFLTPFNRVTRFLLNPFMHTRVMYRALHMSGLSDFYMVQDVGVPYNTAEDFLKWHDEHLSFYPLWLCPLRLRREFPNSEHGLHSEFGRSDAPDLLSFGVWGPLSFSRRIAVSKNRALERKVQELGGKKWLYGHTYYTEDEFWAHYDRKSYDALRAKYSATYLPSVYDKVKVDYEAEEAAVRASWTAWLLSIFWSIWPLRGLYGVFCAVLGGDYLLQTSSKLPLHTDKAR